MSIVKNLNLPARRWYVLVPSLMAATMAYVLTERAIFHPRFEARCSVDLGRLGAGKAPIARWLEKAPQPPSTGELLVVWDRAAARAAIVASSREAGVALSLVTEGRAALRGLISPKLERLLSRTAGEARAGVAWAQRQRALAAQALSLATEDEARDLEKRVRGAGEVLARLESALGGLIGKDPSAYLDSKMIVGDPLEVSPSKPLRSPGTIVLCACAALLVAVLGCWLVERNDTRFRSSAEAQSRLRLPVLGAIPRAQRRAVGAQGLETREGFLELAASVEAAVTQGELRSLAVVSALEKEGKTTIAAGLSAALAARGLRVALLEGNLLEPALHTLFGVNNGIGIADLLRRASAMDTEPVDLYAGLSDPQLFEHATRVAPAGLSVVCAGQVTAPIGLLLQWRKLRPLILRFSRSVDLVICDTRALLAGPDALSVASSTDGALLVVEAERTEGQDVAWARFLLKEAQVSVVGLVLNGTRSGIPGAIALRSSERSGIEIREEERV